MANNKKERIGRPILACLIAALGPVCFGYCLGYSSAALVDLKSAKANSAIRLSDSQGSWFSVSIFCCQCFSTTHFFCSYNLRSIIFGIPVQLMDNVNFRTQEKPQLGYSNMRNRRDARSLVKSCGLKLLRKNANIFTCMGFRLAMCEREKENI